jgi:hypothetical protein
VQKKMRLYTFSPYTLPLRSDPSTLRQAQDKQAQDKQAQDKQAQDKQAQDKCHTAHYRNFLIFDYPVDD